MHMNDTAQTLQVYTADMLPAIDGVNTGDALGFASELSLDDSYRLEHDAKPQKLALYALENGHFRIASETGVGTVGATVVIDSCLTFMCDNSQTKDVLVLVEVDETGDVAQIYAMPLAPLDRRDDHRLVRIEVETAPLRFARIASLGFIRGTHLTLSTGQQRRVEELKPGDMLLTRNSGPQPIRWIGQHTLRASGDFAPVKISKGTLNNANDLLVSPDHRLFVYQREDKLGAGRPEVLLRAAHLVNGHSITVQEGGHVDYFQLLFDDHQIVYAEGIAAETLLISPHTRSALPEDIARTLDQKLSRSAHNAIEVKRSLLAGPNAAELLAQASRGK